MKLSVNNQEEAQLSGVSANVFNLELNPKVYDMIVAKLYRNKEGAIVRELSCNAWDAHVAAGTTDVPFEIQVPTWLDQTVSFRDYGTGIPHEEFENIYTNVGASTKEDSNEFIGAMGLGSKSPFTLTDSFTVENYRDGIKTVWLCFKSAGLPSVSKVVEEPSSEPDGLKVTFTIPKSSIDSFISEIPKQLKFFPVKPKVTGTKFSWVELPKTDKDFFYVKDENTRSYGYSKGYAVMGNVGYPFEYTDLTGPAYDNPYSQLFTGGSLVLKVPLGSVDIPPNRESLELTEKTKEYLRGRLDEIRARHFKEWKESLLKAENLVEAIKLGRTLNTSLCTRKELDEKITVAGKEASAREWGHMAHLDIPQDLVENKYNIEWFYKNPARATTYTDISRLVAITDSDTSKDRLVLVYDYKRKRVALNTLFNDNRTKFSSKTITLFRPTEDKEPQDVIDHFKTLGIQCELLSTHIEEPQPEKRTSTTPRKKTGTYFQLDSKAVRELSWEDMDRRKGFKNLLVEAEEIPKGSYVIQLSGFTPVDTNVTSSYWDKLVVVPKEDLDKVYFCREKAYKELKNPKGYDDFIKDVLKKHKQAAIDNLRGSNIRQQLNTLKFNEIVNIPQILIDRNKELKIIKRYKDLIVDKFTVASDFAKELYSRCGKLGELKEEIGDAIQYTVPERLRELKENNQTYFDLDRCWNGHWASKGSLSLEDAVHLILKENK